MSEIDIKVKTEADLTAAAAAEKQLKAVGQAAEKAGKAGKEGGKDQEKAAEGMLGKFVELKDAFKDAGGGWEGFVNVIAKGGGKIVAAIAAVGAAFYAAKKAVEEYASAEDAITKLDAALAQTGQLTDANRAKYQELASTLQETTGIADEEWTQVLKTLTQYGSTASNIERDANAVKNLAGLLDGDLQSAAMLVSKAMQGNYEAFRRYGIIVDEVGTPTEKLNKLYEQLASRGGGQLEASAKTLNGQFRSLKNAFSDFLEAIGGGIARLGVLQRILGWVAEALRFIAEKLGGVIPAVQGLNNAAAATVQSLEDSTRSGRRYAETLEDIRRLADAVTDATDRQIDAQRNLTNLELERIDAEAAYRTAQVNDRERRGTITPEQAVRQRSAIQRTSETSRFEREQHLRQFELRSRQAQIESNESSIAETNEQRQSVQDAYERNARIAQARTRLHRRLNRDVEIARYEHEMTEWGLDGRNMMDAQHTQGRYDRARNRMVRNLQQFDEENRPTNVFNVEEANTAANQTISSLNQANQRLITQIRNLEQEMRAREEVFDIRQRTAELTTRTDAFTTRRTDVERAQQQTSAARADIVSQAQSGGPITAQPPARTAEQIVRAGEETARALGQTGELTVSQLERLTRITEQQMRSMQRIDTRLNNLEGITNNLRNR